MHKIEIDNKIFWVEDGEVLSAVLEKCGIKHDHPCGKKKDYAANV